MKNVKTRIWGKRTLSKKFNRSSFCGEISGRIYCFDKIPDFCGVLSNEAKGSVDQIHQFCYLPGTKLYNKKIYLPGPRYSLRGH